MIPDLWFKHLDRLDWHLPRVKAWKYLYFACVWGLGEGRTGGSDMW